MNRNNGVRLADSDIEFIFCEIRAKMMKAKIINNLKFEDDIEIKEIVDYLMNNPINTFPYDYRKKYNIKELKVGRNTRSKLLYCKYDDKKIYMKKKYTSPFRVRRYINNILIEQDEHSPHRYLNDTFMPEKDSVVLDIGGAEGLFSAMIIDKVKKVYIFECDKDWIYALKHTFKDYMEKVVIIDRYVDGYSDDRHICLDDFVKQYGLENEKLLIKIDAEGCEPAIISGADKLINSNQDLKIAVCTYHCQEHEDIIRKRFRDWDVDNSMGYMIYYYDFNWSRPYLRRGLLRIQRKNNGDQL